MPPTCSAGIATVLTAAALLFCLPPALVAQPAPSDAHIAVPSADQRDTYILNSEAELDDWQARLLHFFDEAKLQARDDGVATKAGLLTALEKAEARESRLQTAGAENWDDARVSYEKATGELAVAWDKVEANHR